MACSDTYPSKTEIWATFAAAGLMTNPPTGDLAGLDWDGYIDGAIAEWNTLTRRFPYLAEEGTREFATSDLSSVVADPYGKPCRNMAIDTGIISVTEARFFSSTMYGQVNTDGDGVLLQENVDFRLTPVGATGRGIGPYTGIAFHLGHSFANQVGESGIVRITGRFGYSATLPPNVRKMILDLAMLEVAPIVHSAKIAATGVVPGVKIKKQIAGAVKEVSATGQTAGFFLGGEEDKKRIRRKLVAAAASQREFVLA